MIEIALQLKKLRKLAGISQKEIGGVLGITAAGYASYERNHSMPSIERLIKLAEVFHTTVHYIVTGEEHPMLFQEGNITPLSKSLKTLREKGHITQVKASEVMGVSEIMYQRYEYGIFYPKVENLLELAKYYGVTLDELVGRNKKELK